MTEPKPCTSVTCTLLDSDKDEKPATIELNLQYNLQRKIFSIENMKARNLFDSKGGVTVDSYVKVSIDKISNSMTTSVKKNTVHPVWNESFQFTDVNYRKLVTANLDIQVYRCNAVNGDDIIGQITLPLNHLLQYMEKNRDVLMPDLHIHDNEFYKTHEDMAKVVIPLTDEEKELIKKGKEKDSPRKKQSRRDIQRHKLIKYTCLKCHSNFSRFEDPFVHLFHSHGIEIPVMSMNFALELQPKLSCNLCQQTFDGSLDYLVHTRICNKETLQLNKIQKVQTEMSGNLNYECLYCLQKYVQYKDLLKHMSEEHKIFPVYSCENCTAFFLMPSEINHHFPYCIKNAHKKGQLNCFSSGKWIRFDTVVQLWMKNVQSHVNFLPCSKCNALYTDVKLFRAHYMKHQIEKTVNDETVLLNGSLKFNQTHRYIKTECPCCMRTMHVTNLNHCKILKEFLGTKRNCILLCHCCYMMTIKRGKLSVLYLEVVPVAQENINCLKCKCTFENIELFVNHVRTDHNNKNPMYMCTFCPEIFSDIIKWASHLLCVHKRDIRTKILPQKLLKIYDHEVHPNFSSHLTKGLIIPLPCLYCLNCYVNVNDLEDHVFSCHSNSKDELWNEELGTNVCSLCANVLPSYLCKTVSFVSSKSHKKFMSHLCKKCSDTVSLPLGNQYTHCVLLYEFKSHSQGDISRNASLPIVGSSNTTVASVSKDPITDNPHCSSPFEFIVEEDEDEPSNNNLSSPISLLNSSNLTAPSTESNKETVSSNTHLSAGTSSVGNKSSSVLPSLSIESKQETASSNKHLSEGTSSVEGTSSSVLPTPCSESSKETTSSNIHYSEGTSSVEGNSSSVLPTLKLNKETTSLNTDLLEDKVTVINTMTGETEKIYIQNPQMYRLEHSSVMDQQNSVLSTSNTYNDGIDDIKSEKGDDLETDCEVPTSYQTFSLDRNTVDVKENVGTACTISTGILDKEIMALDTYGDDVKSEQGDNLETDCEVSNSYQTFNEEICHQEMSLDRIHINETHRISSTQPTNTSSTQNIGSRNQNFIAESSSNLGVCDNSQHDKAKNVPITIDPVLNLLHMIEPEELETGVENQGHDQAEEDQVVTQQTSENQKLKAVPDGILFDAKLFVDKVKQAFSNNSQCYRIFWDLLIQYGNKQLTTDQVMVTLKKLMSGHPDLFDELKSFESSFFNIRIEPYLSQSDLLNKSKKNRGLKNVDAKVDCADNESRGHSARVQPQVSEGSTPIIFSQATGGNKAIIPTQPNQRTKPVILTQSNEGNSATVPTQINLNKFNQVNRENSEILLIPSNNGSSAIKVPKVVTNANLYKQVKVRNSAIQGNKGISTILHPVTSRETSVVMLPQADGQRSTTVLPQANVINNSILLPQADNRFNLIVFQQANGETRSALLPISTSGRTNKILIPLSSKGISTSVPHISPQKSLGAGVNLSTISTVAHVPQTNNETNANLPTPIVGRILLPYTKGINTSVTTQASMVTMTQASGVTMTTDSTQQNTIPNAFLLSQMNSGARSVLIPQTNRGDNSTTHLQAVTTGSSQVNIGSKPVILSQAIRETSIHPVTSDVMLTQADGQSSTIVLPQATAGNGIILLPQAKNEISLIGSTQANRTTCAMLPGNCKHILPDGCNVMSTCITTQASNRTRLNVLPQINTGDNLTLSLQAGTTTTSLANRIITPVTMNQANKGYSTAVFTQANTGSSTILNPLVNKGTRSIFSPQINGTINVLESASAKQENHVNLSIQPKIGNNGSNTILQTQSKQDNSATIQPKAGDSRIVQPKSYRDKDSTMHTGTVVEDNSFVHKPSIGETLTSRGDDTIIDTHSIEIKSEIDDEQWQDNSMIMQDNSMIMQDNSMIMQDNSMIMPLPDVKYFDADGELLDIVPHVEWPNGESKLPVLNTKFKRKKRASKNLLLQNQKRKFKKRRDSLNRTAEEIAILRVKWREEKRKYKMRPVSPGTKNALVAARRKERKRRYQKYKVNYNDFKIETLSEVPDDLKVNLSSLYTYDFTTNTATCLQCHYTTSRFSGRIKQHVMTHTGGKLWECAYCDQKSNNKSSICTHNVVKHPHEERKIIQRRKPSQFPKRNYNDFKIETLSEVPDDLKVNLSCLYTCDLNTKIATCLQCNYTTTLVRGYYRIKEHVMSHTGGKLWECAYCDHKLKSRAAMCIHTSCKHPHKERKIIRRRPIEKKPTQFKKKKTTFGSRKNECIIQKNIESNTSKKRKRKSIAFENNGNQGECSIESKKSKTNNSSLPEIQMDIHKHKLKYLKIILTRCDK